MPVHGSASSFRVVLSRHAAGERAASESVEDATSQVRIKEAFATPDNLRNCVAFLRSYAADKKARASCAVVPAQQIAYPQVLSSRALHPAHTVWPMHSSSSPSHQPVIH